METKRRSQKTAVINLDTFKKACYKSKINGKLSLLY